MEKAVRLGQPAIAITDHGNLFGVPEFYLAAREAGVEPILGCEFYYVPDVEAYRGSKGRSDDTDSSRYHLTVLARGESGYRALAELSTESYRNFYYKPLVDRSILKAASLDHLTILSGCASSILSRTILTGGDPQEELAWWTTNVPHYYIELQEHGTEFDKRLNTELITLAQRHRIRYVITNDPHYVEDEDCEHHGMLLALQTGQSVDDPNRWSFDGSGYHLRSAKEMREAWYGYPRDVIKRGLSESIEIAKDCQVRLPQLEQRTWLVPKVPGVEDGFKRLRSLVLKALRAREWDQEEEYHLRAGREMEVIKEAGIADFLLIARDSIRWATKRGIPVGPGRGSVCASLVCYLLGIHRVDPIRHNLLFERFLNPARPSMPDIDIDFGQERRDELFGYVKERYGEANVMHVAALQRMKVRGMFTALAKAHGMSYAEAVQVSKNLDTDSDEVILPTEVEERYPELAQQVEKLSGVRSNISNHPAGVIIAAPEHELLKNVPQAYIPSSKRWVAQYDLEAVGELGYLKQDFLGLRTLDTIHITCDLVERKHGHRPDPLHWVPDQEPDDDRVYEMLASGDTAGVFQMEGRANTGGIQAIGCSSFEDIVACTALYRSGPIKAGFPDQYVKNRSARPVLHPILEPILAGTNGVIIYQEQMMQIATDLAGFDMEEVDDLLKAVKKKKPEIMAGLKERFLRGCSGNRVPGKVARKTWKDIEGFATYMFNRAHAVGYSYLSYITARLKCLYPVEFYAALLQTVSGKSPEEKDKRKRYLRALIRGGYRIRPPDVNKSGARCMPVYGSKPGVRFGLQDLAGLGPAKTKKLINLRPFKDPTFVADIVDKRTYSILCEGGALRTLGIEWDIERASTLLGWEFQDRTERYRDVWEGLLVEPDPSEEGPVQVIGELVGVHSGKTNGGKPFQTWVVRWDPSTEWRVRLWSDTQRVWGIPLNSFVRIQGTYQPKWDNVTADGSHSMWVWDRRRWVRANKWLQANQESQSSG